MPADPAIAPRNSTTYEVKDICDRYTVGEHTVLSWIRSGQLRAFNVSRKTGGRPRWRVTGDALAVFEQSRTPTPTLPRKRRTKRAAGEIIEFYN